MAPSARATSSVTPLARLSAPPRVNERSLAMPHVWEAARCSAPCASSDCPAAERSMPPAPTVRSEPEAKLTGCDTSSMRMPAQARLTPSVSGDACKNRASHSATSVAPGTSPPTHESPEESGSALSAFGMAAAHADSGSALAAATPSRARRRAKALSEKGFTGLRGAMGVPVLNGLRKS